MSIDNGSTSINFLIFSSKVNPDPSIPNFFRSSSIAFIVFSSLLKTLSVIIFPIFESPLIKFNPPSFTPIHEFFATFPKSLKILLDLSSFTALSALIPVVFLIVDEIGALNVLLTSLFLVISCLLKLFSFCCSSFLVVKFDRFLTTGLVSPL